MVTHKHPKVLDQSHKKAIKYWVLNDGGEYVHVSTVCKYVLLFLLHIMCFVCLKRAVFTFLKSIL